MSASTLERSPEYALDPEMREYSRPSVAELESRCEVMRQAGIPSAVFETVGKQGTASVWQEYIRADVAPGNSFKVRGAYMAVSRAIEKRNVTHFVTASAGNHAQGVAYAVNQLGGHATIFMPESTPQVKIEGVKELGGTNITFDTSAESFEKAQILAQNHGAEYISPYDDYDVIAGQGTVIYEALRKQPDTDVVFDIVGGGGKLASDLEVVDVLKRAGHLKPSFKVVAVVYEGNDSLIRTLENDGKPQPASKVDSFCEGTAVVQPGDIPAEMIWRDRKHLEVMTVTKKDLAETLAAIKARNNTLVELGHEPFPLPETTGLLAAAGAQKRARQRTMQSAAPELWLVMVTGSNADAGKLSELDELYGKSDKEKYHEDVVYDLGNRACMASSGRVGNLH